MSSNGSQGSTHPGQDTLGRTLLLVGSNVEGFTFYVTASYGKDGLLEQFAFTEDEISQIASDIGCTPEELVAKMGPRAGEMTLREVAVIGRHLRSSNSDISTIDVEVSGIDDFEEGAEEDGIARGHYFPR